MVTVGPFQMTLFYSMLLLSFLFLSVPFCAVLCCAVRRRRQRGLMALQFLQLCNTGSEASSTQTQPNPTAIVLSVGIQFLKSLESDNHRQSGTEKTFKVIEFSHKPRTAKCTTKPCRTHPQKTLNCFGHSSCSRFCHKATTLFMVSAVTQRQCFHGSARFVVGLDDLKGLFHPK